MNHGLQEILNTELKNLWPCYIFWGQNDYDKNEIICAFKKKLEDLGALEFDLFSADPDTATFSDIITHAQSFPFLSLKKIIIYKNISSMTDEDKELLDDYFKHPSPSACICLFILNKRYATGNLFKNPAVIKSYDLEEDTKAAANIWVKDFFKNKNKKIDQRTLELLLRCLPENKIAIGNELEKFITYIGEKEVITEKDVYTNFNEIYLHNIFQLMDEISAGKMREAMLKTNQMMKANVSAQEIVNVMYWHFKRLWMAVCLKEKGIAIPQILKTVGIKDWAKDHFIKQMNKYNKIKLKKIFYKLFEIDFNLRNPAIPSKIHVEKLILDIYQMVD